MDEYPEKRPVLKNLSKTPSWVSLGFVMGALFVWLLPRPEPKVIEVPVKDPNPPLVASRIKPDFTEIEAVFAQWSEYAVWDHDTTEVALWDVATNKYSRFYEILRNGETYYYRSIAHLTRPLLTHGVSVNAPLLFTEPEAKRKEWLEQKDAATWQAISDSIKRDVGKPLPPPPREKSP